MSHKIIRLNIDVTKHEQKLEVPMFSKPLSVGIEGRDEFVNLLVDEDEKLMETLHLRFYQTDRSFSRDEHDTQYYLGTTVDASDSFRVWETHVFVVYNAEESS